MCLCKTIFFPRSNFICTQHTEPQPRPTKRPVTARNPLLVVLLILSPRRVAISLEESPCCAPNRDKFHLQALAQRVTWWILVTPISPKNFVNPRSGCQAYWNRRIHAAIEDEKINEMLLLFAQQYQCLMSEVNTAKSCLVVKPKRIY